MCDSTCFHDIFDREDQRTVKNLPHKHFENVLNCQSSYNNCQNCTNSRKNSDKLKVRWVGRHKFQKSKSFYFNKLFHLIFLKFH